MVEEFEAMRAARLASRPKGATMKLRIGYRVLFRDSNTGGEFEGWIAEIEGKDGRPTVAHIEPYSDDVRRFLGGNGHYALGVAHWDSCLTITNSHGHSHD
jgi:hypothetical protein